MQQLYFQYKALSGMKELMISSATRFITGSCLNRKNERGEVAVRTVSSGALRERRRRKKKEYMGLGSSPKISSF